MRYYLIISVVMAIVTTLIIILCFCYLDATAANLVFISMISMLGYLVSFLYYITYKDSRL
jgi:hypothetical protein